MSKKFLISVLLSFFVLNTAALALTNKVFTDEGVFASWYAKEVKELSDRKIITGYKDGSFRPDNLVSRAENAVIVDRAYNDIIDQMGEAMMAYDGLKDVIFEKPNTDDVSTPKVALAMAIAQLKPLENFSLKQLGDKAELSDVVKLKASNLPKGYLVYRLSTLPTYEYYVNWVSDEVVPESGGEIAHFDKWYGPFEPSLWYMNQ